MFTNFGVTVNKCLILYWMNPVLYWIIEKNRLAEYEANDLRVYPLMNAPLYRIHVDGFSPSWIMIFSTRIQRPPSRCVNTRGINHYSTVAWVLVWNSMKPHQKCYIFIRNVCPDIYKCIPERILCLLWYTMISSGMSAWNDSKEENQFWANDQISSTL